jgi:hypothetical protein
VDVFWTPPDSLLLAFLRYDCGLKEADRFLGKDLKKLLPALKSSIIINK